VTGLFRVLPEPAYDEPLGWIVAGALAAIAAFAVIGARGGMSPRFFALLTALGVLWILTGIAPKGGLYVHRFPEEGRYLLPGAILFGLLFAEVGGAPRISRPIAWGVVLVLAVGICANLDALHGYASRLHRQADYDRGILTAARLWDGTAPGESTPTIFFAKSAAGAQRAMNRYGYPGYGEDELAGGPPAGQLGTDATLISGLLQLRLDERAPRPAAGRAGEAPHVDARYAVSTRRRGPCLELWATARRDTASPGVPPPPGTPVSSTPPLAQLELPTGGVSISSRALRRARFRLGRFTNPAIPPLEAPPHGGSATLRIPRDDVPVPWRLLVYSAAPVSVCGLS